MKSFAYALALALAATAAAAPAMADAPKGARIEAQIGFDHASYDASQYGYGTYSKNGFNYGGTIGYDLPVASNVSVGIDVGANGSTAKYTSGSAALKLGRDLYAGGRVSYAFTTKANLYALVGYTNGRISLSAPGYYEAANGDGVRFGAGLQHAVTDKGYLSLQYDHTSYQDHFSRDRVLVGAGIRF